MAAIATMLVMLTASAAMAQQSTRVMIAPAPRVVTATDLQQLLLYDPFHDRFHVDGETETEDETPRTANDSPDYADRLFRSITPSVQMPPTDGPLAAKSTQAFGYQPHLTASFAVRDSGSWSPPDCTMAAGPNHVVVAFNSYVQFFTKNGQRTFTSSLDALLGSKPGWKKQFDPKVVYDEGSGRFYIMSLNLNLSARQSDWSVAVSITSDPNQGWYVYSGMRNELDGRGVDYEDLGFGARAIYLCGNLISFGDWSAIPPPASYPSHTNLIWVMDKAAMLAGQAVSIYSIVDLVGDGATPVFLPRVAQVQGAAPAGLDGFVSAWQAPAAPPNTLRVSVWGVTLPANFPISGPSLSRNTVDLAQPSSVPNAQQRGGLGRLQANNIGSAQLSLYFRNGTLTMPFHEGVGGGSGVGILQITTAWPTLTVAYRATYNDGVNFHLWPNVAVNSHGQMGMVYYRAGTSEYANVRWSTKTIDDPGFTQSQLLKAGEGYVGNPVTDSADSLYRWGDYSGVAVDPVSQGFWYFGMYGFNRGNDDATDFRMWCGYMPRAVYVDASWFGSQAGTTQRPWNAFFSAMADADNTDEIVMKAGIYHTPGIIIKPVTIIADGGTVQIQFP